MNFVEVIAKHIPDLKTLWQFTVLFPKIPIKSFYTITDDGVSNVLWFKDELVYLVTFSSGRKTEETGYRRKKKNGPHRGFGNEITGEGRYSNDKKNGYWIYKYANGIISDEGEYINDRPNGLWIGNYKNGKRRYEDGFSDGVNNGIHRTFSNEGNPRIEGQ